MPGAILLPEPSLCVVGVILTYVCPYWLNGFGEICLSSASPTLELPPPLILISMIRCFISLSLSELNIESANAAIPLASTHELKLITAIGASFIMRNEYGASFSYSFISFCSFGEMTNLAFKLSLSIPFATTFFSFLSFSSR